jgi:hypothetical protein
MPWNERKTCIMIPRAPGCYLEGFRPVVAANGSFQVKSLLAGCVGKLGSHPKMGIPFSGGGGGVSDFAEKKTSRCSVNLANSKPLGSTILIFVQLHRRRPRARRRNPQETAQKEAAQSEGSRRRARGKGRPRPRRRRRIATPRKRQHR